MRILNIIQCANLGGMEKASLRLMQALRLRGHELELISLHPIGSLGPLLADVGIPAEGLPYAGLGGWRSWWRLRRAIRRRRPDAVVLTGHHLLAMLAVGACPLERRLLSIHFHHAGERPVWFWRLFYAIANLRFACIAFPSDFVRREAIALSPSIAAKAHTVRLPLDPPALISAEECLAARRELNLPVHVPIIGNAGWLIPRKRFDVFLRVASRVRERCPECRFVIAGDGPESTRLRQLACSLGLSDALVWLGWQHDMRRFYACLNALLFNSDWDCLPVTPQEALAHGVPVVSSILNGGLNEIIRPGQDAVLLDQHDIDALASHLLQVIENPEEASRQALQGRLHLLAIGDPQAIAAWHERALGLDTLPVSAQS